MLSFCLTCFHKMWCFCEVVYFMYVSSHYAHFCMHQKSFVNPGIAQFVNPGVAQLEVDHVLITALVERRHPETHIFHLLHGEMGITLQDIEVMLGVLADRLPVTGSVKMDWPGLCRDLLGRVGRKWDHHRSSRCRHSHFFKIILPSTMRDMKLVMYYIAISGLLVVSRISLLDSRFLEYQNVVIGTVQTTLNAGTVFVTLFSNFNMSLKDPHLCDALKVQVQITGASQVQDTFAATLHYQLAYRLQNHAFEDYGNWLMT
ncbi:hypothetical protein SO802_006324 [Lithocarpus litseifolius]|uniref:Aminotransferase-like plant mobile domain-containing protein n=1 Tax=Lithocarpus litseifolius TaxID=425828 RepID=A0AAW2DLC5_9ROSI